jgi:hypothetical protein
MRRGSASVWAIGCGMLSAVLTVLVSAGLGPYLAVVAGVLATSALRRFARAGALPLRPTGDSPTSTTDALTPVGPA